MWAARLGLALWGERGWECGAGREGKLGAGSWELVAGSGGKLFVFPDTAFRMLLIGTLAVFIDLTNLYLGTETDPCLYLLYLTGASVLDIVLLCVSSVFCDTFLCNLGVTDLPVSFPVVYTDLTDLTDSSSDS